MEKLITKQLMGEPRQFFQMTSLSGLVIYLALTVSLLSLLLFSGNVYAIILNVVFGIRLLFTRQRLVITSCLFLFILFGLYFLYVNNQTKIGLELKDELLLNKEIAVQADTVDVNGQSLKFTAIIDDTGEKIKVTHWLATKDMHDYFTHLDKQVILKVSGELTTIPIKRNLGTFDYKKYLAQQGIFRQLKIDKIGSKANDRTLDPVGIIKTWRAKATHFITNNFPVTTASYVKSLFIGVKDHEFKMNQNKLSRLGILHFFSISGLHVYFFLGLLTYGLKRLGLFPTEVYVIELLFLVIFLGLTGFATSVGRSVFYILILKTVQQYRLNLSALDAWSLALLFSLGLNPYLLLTAAGQLSFGLTGYILFLTPIVNVQVVKQYRLLVFTIALTVLSVPIVSYNFYEWQIGSLILTIVLMPVFSLILMPGLFGLVLIQSVSHSTLLIKYVDYFLSKGQDWLFTLNEINLLHIVTGRVPLALILLTIGVSLIWLSRERPSVRFSFLCLGSVLVLISGFKYVDPRGIIAFVDVGQGDGLIIKEPFNRGTVIIDTGGKIAVNDDYSESWQRPAAKSSGINYDMVPILKYLGVSELEMVFITHGHVDHFGNLPMIAEQFPIKKLVYPRGTPNQQLFNELTKKLARKNILQEEVLSGYKWCFHEYQLTALAPSVPGHGNNDNSLVLQTQIKNKRFLLMGDLEKNGEDILVNQPLDLKADILSTGHHGSKTSSQDFFINKVQPSEAIISCGIDNRFGHPNQETLTNLVNVGSKVLRTDQQGMIYYTWTPFGSKLSSVKTAI